MESLNANDHHATIEIMSVVPKLRDDIEISLQVYSGRTCYLIEDPVSSRFYRLGTAEYTLVSLLDGKTTIAEAIGKTAAIMGPGALTEQEAASLCKWLIDSQLASTEHSRCAGRLHEARHRSSLERATATFHPMFQKVRLFNPEPYLRWLLPVCGWALTAPAALVWFAVVAFGSYCLWSDWDQFMSASSTVLARDNWMWLFATWLGLKVVHETGHALACKRFGGTVREAGVVLVLLSPMPFVDVTSAWRFDSKWKRIATSAAGMYVELLIAALAAIVWSWSDDELVRQHARNIILTASLVTILFNANPLMRFDGYYMLTDWLGLPNLATHGRQYVSYLAKRFLMGMPVKRPVWPEGKAVWVGIYALAAFVWRILICVMLAIAAEALFFGAGIVLALVAIAVWIAPAGYNLLQTTTQTGAVDRRRMASIVAAAALMVWAAWTWVPWYARVTVPAIVDYHPRTEVRSPVGGFVREVLVQAGDFVEAGQLLAVLENRELQLEAERLRIEVEQSRQRARQFRHAGEITACQVETRNGQALQDRLEQLNQQISHLRVRAVVDGQVISSQLQFREGTFLPAGERILTLGGDDGLRVHALVQQDIIEAFRQPDRQQLAIHVWGAGRGKLAGTIETIQPRATTELVHPALTSLGGGPLPVRTKPAGDPSSDAAWELVVPHFPMRVRCEFDQARQLKPGQTGFVQLRYCRGTLGEVVLIQLRRWFRDRREQAMAISRASE